MLIGNYFFFAGGGVAGKVIGAEFVGAVGVEAFLSAYSEFARAPLSAAELFGHAEWISPKGDLKTLPCHLSAQGGMDGFYAARLKRL